MFDNLRGVITFEAVSPEPEHFLNMLRNSSVTVRDINTSRGRIYGDIYNSDFADVRKIASECSTQICVKKKKGGIFTVQKYRRRTGMIIGIILACIMAAYFSNTVMIIEIYGNETLADKQITSLLSDCGITIGAFIPGLDLRNAERRIVSSCDDIAWIGIRSNGCKIQAEISEITSPPEMIPTSVPCNIVSSRDAQIVAIKSVRMGMLIPMLYDGVKKGDILISGTVEDGKGGVYYAHSMGEIIGRYTDEVTFTQPFEDEYFDYGEKLFRKKLFILGIKIPLYIEGSIPENYEYDEEIKYAGILGIKLPAGTVISEYKPYEIKKAEYSREQAMELIKERIKLYEYNFFDEGDIALIDREVTLYEEENSVKAVVKYTLESDIGITQEIMAK